MDDMEWLLLFTLVYFKHCQAKFRLRRILAMVLARRRRQLARRGRYCQLSFLNSDIQAIMNGDARKTRAHIRITPLSLRMLVEKLPRKGQGWSTEFEAIIFLYWLACGTCFRIIGCVFNIPRATAHRVVRRILKNMMELVHTIIKVPSGEQLLAVGQGFAEMCRSPVFGQVAGAIDGCQIRTMVPTHLHDQYINQKLFYSLLMQGVCDHNGKFIDIFVGLPGSVHDMRALRLSHLYRNATYPPRGWFLIGDKGYACIRDPIAVVPPFKEPLTREKRGFNYHLSRGRCRIERVFGEMEIRWRSIYTKALEVSLTTGVKVLAACAVMHNVCVAAGDVLALEAQRVDVEPNAPAPRDEATGREFRELLLQLHTLNANQERLEMEARDLPN